MSEAKDLLNSLSEAEYASYSEVTPINDILLIDAESRIINVPSTEILFGVETDKDVERKYFKCPRTVGDNVDLSTLSLRVHFQNANGEKDKYIIEDVKVDGQYITFSWLLSAKVLKYKGSVQFTIVAVSINDDGTLKNEWNTTLASGNVLEGLEVDDLDYVEEEQARDVLLQLLKMLEDETAESIQKVQTEGTNQVAAVQAEGATQVEAVEKKGAETLATIPEDYTELNNTVEQHTTDIYDLARNKANAIVGEVVGDVIYVQDAAEQPPVELSLFGKSEQASYPGYQLFDASKLVGKNENGITVTNNGDGSFTVSSSNTNLDATLDFMIMHTYTHEETVELIKAAGTYKLLNDCITTPYMYVAFINTDGYIGELNNQTGTNVSVSITDEHIADESFYIRIGFYGYRGDTIHTGTTKPMLYLEGDGTWEPFTGGKPAPNPEYPVEMESIENPKLVKLGKNLLKESNITASTSQHSITCDYEGDGVFHIYGTFSGTHGGMQLATSDLNIPIDLDADYTISVQLMEGTLPDTFHPFLGVKSDSVNLMNWFCVYTEPTLNVGDIVTSTYKGNSALSDATHIAKFWIYSYNDDLTAYEADFRIKVWVEKGTGSDYETCNEQAIDIPYTLRGIKVTGTQYESSANYADSDSVKYAGDYIDFVTNEHVQMIGTKTYVGTENWALNSFAVGNGIQAFQCGNKEFDSTYGNCPAMCNRLINANWLSLDDYDNYIYATQKLIIVTLADQSITTVDDFKTWLTEHPLEVQYLLAEPVRTALTAEEIAAYRELLMSYPITTLYNSSGATMKLKYGINTKSYVDSHGSTVTKDSITLTAANWVASSDSSYYTQSVNLSGITENTKVDLDPTPEQLVSLIGDGISMFAVNENGSITIYATGDKPANDMTIQIVKSEVVYV